MGTMVENIRELCKERGIAVSRMEADLGYGNGYLNPKKIKTITAARAVEIAEYLGVSVDEILGSETKKAPAGEGERAVTEDDIKAAFWGGEDDLPEEAIAELWEDAKSYIAFKTEQMKKKKRR